MKSIEQRGKLSGFYANLRGGYDEHDQQRGTRSRAPDRPGCYRPMTSRSPFAPGGDDPDTASLHQARLDYVFERMKQAGARRVLDLGCGSGSLLARLVAEPQFEEIVGLELSGESLIEARDTLIACQQGSAPRLRFVRGSYLENHDALADYDAAAMVETIEHIKPERLSRLESAVFGQMRPGLVCVTTPNREYNPLFNLGPGQYREFDHKFEWDRSRFRRWAAGVARRNGYGVTFDGVGEWHHEFGHPTQTATFMLRKGDCEGSRRIASVD